MSVILREADANGLAGGQPMVDAGGGRSCGVCKRTLQPGDEWIALDGGKIWCAKCWQKQFSMPEARPAWSLDDLSESAANSPVLDARCPGTSPGHPCSETEVARPAYSGSASPEASALRTVKAGSPALGLKMRAGLALGSGVAVTILVAFSVFAWNYFLLQGPMNSVLTADARNEGIEVSVHHMWYLKPSVLVYDLRTVPMHKSPGDVFRVFLQFAEKVKDHRFAEVHLCHCGEPKFRITGDYFHTLGAEYPLQNPTYTMRTFPENLATPEGGRAYAGRSGGWLEVLTRQLEDFKDFHEKWYVRDMARR